MSSYGDRDTIIAKSGLTYESLGLDSEAELDTLIDTLIEQASGMVDRYCNRDFNDHAETITMDGNGRSVLMTPGYPILSIISLKENDKTLIAGTDYRIRKDSLLDSNSGILDKKNSIWSCDWDNIEINYTHGYTTTPPEIAGAVENMVVALMTRTAGLSQGEGVSSYSMDGFSVTFKSEMGKTVWEENKTTFDRFKVTGVR